MAERNVNPDMLVLARESRDMNQTDLAQAVGVSQAKISKYENGILAVSDEDLDAIARATGYTPDFFCQTDKVYGLGSSVLFNRKQQTVPMAVQRRVQANVNILRMQIERLLRGAEVEAENQFEPIDIQRFDGDATAVARMVRAAWRLPIGPVQNVTATIESAGGIIMLCDFSASGIDAAHLWLPGLPPLFFMNKNVPGDRHRFNLAHELGHAIMHRFPTGDIEEEANTFAREFLVPSREVEQQFAGGVTVEKLARLKPYWKVSMQMLAFHAHRMGCIGAPTYRKLFTRFSALGYRKNEPIPIPLEEPTIVPQLVAIHKRAFGYSDEDMQRLLFDRNPEPTFFRLLGGETPGQLRISGGPMSIHRATGGA